MSNDEYVVVSDTDEGSGKAAGRNVAMLKVIGNAAPFTKNTFSFTQDDPRAFVAAVSSKFNIAAPKCRYLDGETIDLESAADCAQLAAMAVFAMQSQGTCLTIQVADAGDDSWVDALQLPNGRVVPFTLKYSASATAEGTEEAAPQGSKSKGSSDKDAALHESFVFDLDEQLRRLEKGLQVEQPALVHEDASMAVNEGFDGTNASAALTTTSFTTSQPRIVMQNSGSSGNDDDDDDEADMDIFVSRDDTGSDEEEYHDCIWWMPASHPISKFFEIATMVVILVSIFNFVVETIPTYRLDENGEERTGDLPTFFAIESVCIAWFTIEYLMRLYAAENRIKKWIWQPLNLIDLIAILPYYIAFIVGSSGASSLAVVRILRLTRVTRLFKISRHSQGLRDMIIGIAGARKQLVLFFLITSVAVVLFGSAIFYCEKDEPETGFISIPEGFWWAIVTLTTVGYGDISPVTIQGKFVGALAASFGVVLVAIPAGIFISEFIRIHEERQLMAEVDLTHERALLDIQAAVSDLTGALDRYKLARRVYDKRIKKEVVQVIDTVKGWDHLRPTLRHSLSVVHGDKHKKRRYIGAGARFVAA